MLALLLSAIVPATATLKAEFQSRSRAEDLANCRLELAHATQLARRLLPGSRPESPYRCDSRYGFIALADGSPVDLMNFYARGPEGRVCHLEIYTLNYQEKVTYAGPDCK